MADPASSSRPRPPDAMIDTLDVVRVSDALADAVDEEHALEVVGTALGDLGPYRVLGRFLRGDGWHHTRDDGSPGHAGGRADPAQLRRLEDALESLPAAGGPLPVAPTGDGPAAATWCWALPLFDPPLAGGFLLVEAPAAPDAGTFAALQLLARRTGAVVLARRHTDLRRRYASNLLREEVLSGLGHDMQSPLASIVGFAELLADSPNLPVTEREEMYGILVRQARSLKGLVQRFLADRRLDHDHLASATRATDVGAVVERVVGLLDVDRRIRVDRDPAVPVAQADAGRLEQVVSNLVSNALKYSPAESPVSVGVRATPEHVVVEVTDRGRGMNAEDLRAVFAKFERGTNTTGTSGSGLGLYVSRALVEAQGGRIEVTSEPGHGTSFRVLLRRAHSAGRVAPRVVLADDDADVRTLLRLRLQSAGYDVEECVAADEVLAACRRAPVPAVAVLDQHLPGRTGLEVARALQAEDRDVEVLLFSAHLGPDDERAARRLGIRTLAKTEVSMVVQVVDQVAGGAEHR